MALVLVVSGCSSTAAPSRESKPESPQLVPSTAKAPPPDESEPGETPVPPPRFEATSAADGDEEELLLDEGAPGHVEQMRARLRRFRTRITRCYGKALKKHANLGQEPLQTSIETRAGEIIGITITGSSHDLSELENCLESSLEGVAFPGPADGSAGTITYPLALETFAGP